MFEFRTAPVELAVAAVRTWVDLAWPVSRDQIGEVRDRLGWSESPTNDQVFTTTFGFDGDGHFVIDGDDLGAISFQLSNLVPREVREQWKDQTGAAYQRFVDAFTTQFGTPTLRPAINGVSLASWVSTNGAGVTLTGAEWLIEVEVKSPEFVALMESEDA